MGRSDTQPAAAWALHHLADGQRCEGRMPAQHHRPAIARQEALYLISCCISRHLKAKVNKQLKLDALLNIFGAKNFLFAIL